jgi:hypothetical protein
MILMGDELVSQSSRPIAVATIERYPSAGFYSKLFWIHDSSLLPL